MLPFQLNAEEAEHLADYRQLTPGQREVVKELTREMTGRESPPANLPFNVVPLKLSTLR